ncbi:S1 family peptidase [Streptomyces sp. 4N509B]|uniref:S1 family peptidase n=1 Tax=Streptomyces sp. 4N509B TaxID=3457413 RepID=UPI003FD410B3
MPNRFRRRARAVLALAAAAIAAAGVLTAAPAAQADEASTRIVGGTITTTDRYPYVMQITDADRYQFCGGTLVAPNKIVTAAHCVDWVSDPGEIRAIGGRTYLDGTDGTVRRVTDVWVHPNWNPDRLRNDVAVLTLLKPMPYDALPIASSTDTHLYEEGRISRILGWGTTSEGGWSSNRLRTARVPVVSDVDCKDSYPVRYHATSMVCAGVPEGGVDTCQGDSGGPLVIGGRLAGITSWGNGCAREGYPGVYARMTTFSDAVAAQIAS